MPIPISSADLPTRSIGLYCCSDTKNDIKHKNTKRLVKIGMTSSNMRMRVFGYGICYTAGYYLYSTLRIKDEYNHTKPNEIKTMTAEIARETRRKQRAWVKKYEQELFTHLKKHRYFSEHNKVYSEWFSLTVEEVEEAFQWLSDKYPEIFLQPKHFHDHNYIKMNQDDLDKLIDEETYPGDPSRIPRTKPKEQKRMTRSQAKEELAHPTLPKRQVHRPQKLNEFVFWK